MGHYAGWAMRWQEHSIADHLLFKMKSYRPQKSAKDAKNIDTLCVFCAFLRPIGFDFFVSLRLRGIWFWFVLRFLYLILKITERFLVDDAELDELQEQEPFEEKG